jgi:hypothetical protein
VLDAGADLDAIVRQANRSLADHQKIRRALVWPEPHLPRTEGTSKLKRAQDRVIGARPYAVALGEVLGGLYAPDLAEQFPLLRRPEAGAIRRAALLLITSNRGLCGRSTPI